MERGVGVGGERGRQKGHCTRGTQGSFLHCADIVEEVGTRMTFSPCRGHFSFSVLLHSIISKIRR